MKDLEKTCNKWKDVLFENFYLQIPLTCKPRSFRFTPIEIIDALGETLLAVNTRLQQLERTVMERLI